VTRGLVYAEPGERPRVEELTLDPPGAGEVQVRIEACGVCHTDLHVVATGGWGMTFPILLGHEGAGAVEEIGEGVTSVAPGDRVVVPGARRVAIRAGRAGVAIRAAARTISGRGGGCTGPQTARFSTPCFAAAASPTA
jgi:threonine dehydrogenase-like Zn-dependent dehydrogenase